MINKLALLISHNIFLTNDQIETLIQNRFLQCEGVSVPVWVNAKNGKTTEPASEVFVNYEIFTNCDLEDVEITKKGYKISIPKLNWKPPKPMIDTSDLEEEQRKYYERKREKWWREHPAPMNIDSLDKTKYFRIQIKKLDQEFSKLNAKADIQHTIEIKTIDSLIESLA